MAIQRKSESVAQPSTKRMLATGRKINGVWQVKTFLRAAAGGGTAFWEGTRGSTRGPQHGR
jgi:hypothetical protein